MKKNSDYKFFKSFDNAMNASKSLTLIKYLIFITQTLSVIFLMLRAMQLEIEGSIIYISQFVNNINDKFFTKNIADFFSIIGLTMAFVIGVLGIIRINIVPDYDEIGQHKKIQKIILIVELIIVYTLQFLIYLIFWSYTKTYQDQGLVFFILKGLFPILAYSYFNYKFQTLALYKWYTVPMVIQLTIFQNIFSYFFIISISIYFLLTHKKLINKILYSLVIVFAVFVLKNSKVFQQISSSEMKTPFLCLGILVVLMPILVYKLKQVLYLKKSEQKLQNCFKMLAELKGNIPHSQLKFYQFYQLYNSILHFTFSNRQQKSIQLDAILQKRPEQITKFNFLFLLQKYLQKECKKTTGNSFLNQIFLLRIRMTLNYPMSLLIQELFLLHEQLQRSNKKYQIQFFKLYDQIVKKYAIFKNGELQPAYISYMNKLHENFQNDINDLLDNLHSFWLEISKDQIQKSSLDSNFSRVLEFEEKIQKNYKNMQKAGIFQHQRILIQICRTMLNAYEEEGKITNLNLKKPNQALDNQLTHSFLILQNKVIKFISKDLLKILNEKGSLTFQNVDKKILFGEDFSDIIDNRIKNLNTKNQTQQFTIPIFCKKGYMQLKKIKILWFPSLQTKSRYLIKFAEDPQLMNQAYIVYHFKTDTVRYFNQKFIHHFNIDLQKFEYQLNNYGIFFNQLFLNTDVPLEQIKNVLKNEQIIRGKIYLKKYLQNGGLQSIPVQIRPLKCISIQNEPTYCILKLNKLKQKKQISDNSTPQNNLAQNKNNYNTTNKYMSSNQNILAKKYQNQTFFCKIPNHYESKITQKQAQLQESGRWVYRYFLHVIFGLMFICILVFWILDYNFMTSRINSYQKYNSAIQNVSQQYALFYQSYSVAIKRYYIKKYPQQTLMIKKVPGFVYDSIYATVQQSFLNQFLRRYLTQINQQPNFDISYQIDFDYFSIQTDTDKSTLMDFAQHFKRNIATGQIDFLLKNYDNFRNLTVKYENSFNYQDSIDQIVQSYTIYTWVLITTTIVSIVVILLILFKIQEAIEVVYTLLELITHSQFKQNVKNFKIKRQKLTNLFQKKTNGDIISNQKDLSTKRTIQKSQNSSQYDRDQRSVVDQKQNQKISILQGNTQNQKNQQSFLLNQNQINEKKTLIKNYNQQTNKQKSKIIDQSLMTKSTRKLFFIILLCALNIVFYFDYRALIQQRDGIIQAFNIKRDLYIMLLHVKREQVDAPMKPTLEDFFNTNKVNSYYSNKVYIISQIKINPIFKQLQNFVLRAKQAIQGNLCSKLDNLKVAVKPCQNYLNGVVTKGFGQTFDIYKENAKIVNNLKIKQFGPYPCTIEKCPPYFQHQFVSILLGQNVRYVILLLNKEINNTFDLMLSKGRASSIYKILGLIVAGIFYILYDRSLKERCKKSIKYFRIIPKNIICSMKITTYMKKNKILSKFDIL